MADLKLNLACWNYDRTRALADGSVKPAGIELTYHDIFVADTFGRMVRTGEFEVSEMGFSIYVGTVDRGDAPFVAIPVFPLRIFRHSSIFVNTESGVEKPSDLIGKTVGEMSFYGHDAGTWAKGALSDEYGVRAEDVKWVVGGLTEPANRDYVPWSPPANVTKIGADQQLDAMLESGEIAAYMGAVIPPSFMRGSPKVRRLFVDYEPIERAYYRKTKIFPAMHTLVIRRDVYEANRWVAKAMFDAFNAAKAKAYAHYRSGDPFFHGYWTVPWMTNHLMQNRELMGDDPWPYGLEENRVMIEAFLRLHHEQGMSKRHWRPEEIFAPETLEL